MVTDGSPMDRDVGTVLVLQAKSAAEGDVSMWTIYDHPTDHPDGFIARRFEAGKKGARPTYDTLAGTLQEIRATFERAGLTAIARSPEDDRKIVETWL